MSNPRSESVLGGALPNPRTVSNGVHAAPGGPEVRATDITLHAFQMGQFLDHDVIATPTQSGRAHKIKKSYGQVTRYYHGPYIYIYVPFVARCTL